MRIEYRSNNSGGDWWLTDSDWKKLEGAGWDVAWLEEPWLDANATCAYRSGLGLSDAIREWQRVLDMDPHDQGCECCGRPHYFSEEDE